MSYFAHIMAKELYIVDVEGVWKSSNEYFLGDKTSLESIKYSECTSGSALSNSEFFWSWLCSWDTRKALPPLLSPLPGRPLPPLLDSPQVTPTGSGTPLCLPPLAAWGVAAILCILFLFWDLYKPTQISILNHFLMSIYTINFTEEKTSCPLKSLYSYYRAWQTVI